MASTGITCLPTSQTTLLEYRNNIIINIRISQTYIGKTNWSHVLIDPGNEIAKNIRRLLRKEDRFIYFDNISIKYKSIDCTHRQSKYLFFMDIRFSPIIYISSIYKRS